MSGKHEVWIGAGDWFDENRDRIGIYNSNYIGNFETHDMKHSKPWRLASRDSLVCAMKFTTQEEAATYVREHLGMVSAEEAVSQ